MKACCSLLACAALLSASFAAAQEKSPATPQRVGLIDMGYVFQNYQKFSTLTDALQQEIEQTDAQAKSLIDRVRAGQERLKTAPPGTPEHDQAENELVRAGNELEAFKRTAQRDFLRKEADIYKTVYLEVQDAVTQYAGFYHYALILRFDRADLGTADDPRQIINGMNRPVVFHQPEDDITEPVLGFLNEKWNKR